MKKFSIFIILAALAMILAACGGKDAAKKDPNAPFSKGPPAPPAISTPTTPQPK